MSHSQFHSTNLFILRHAWLNLWDKHMTTGRINQVTTFRPYTPIGMQRTIVAGQAHFLVREFVKWIDIDSTETFQHFPQGYSYFQIISQTALFPGLTFFRHTSRGRKQQPRSWPSERTTYNRQYCSSIAQSKRIPDWLDATGLAISK